MGSWWWGLASFVPFSMLAATTPAPEWARILGSAIAALMYHLATRRLA